MRCLVTGGTGFIGSYVVKSLVEAGHEVIALYYSNRESQWLNELLTDEERERVTFVQGDVTDGESIRRIIVNNGCETIAHLASKLNQKTRSNPKVGIKTNIMAFQDILQVCREEKIKRIVWASSSAVYGVQADRQERYGEQEDVILNENTPLCPGSLYSYTKAFNEGLSEFYRAEYGLDAIALRINLSYGPYIKSSFQPFFSSLVDLPALEMSSEVPYSDTMFDYQYVGDIADAFRSALLATPTRSGIFNTRGEYRSVNDAIGYLRALIPDLKIKPLGGQMGIPFHFDTSALEAEIGYIPQHSMEEGLRKSINMVRRGHGLEEI